MATIDQLKDQIDLHDLADKLGLERPGGQGNYRSPVHADKTPSLSIYDRDGKLRWKDHSTGEGGACIDLVMYTEGCDVATALKRLHELYNLPLDKPGEGPPRAKTLAEGIAERSLALAERALDYLCVERGVPEETVRAAIKAKTVGFNDYTSDKRAPGEVGHCGPAVAFIVRTLNPGHVAAVELRYLDPALNGGVKTQTQGEKNGAVWVSNGRVLKGAKTIYLVESPINALSVEGCGLKSTAAIALRGLSNVEHVDWRFLRGKRVVICMDNDEPMEQHGGYCPGAKAAWQLHERLTTLNVASHLVDQGDWEHNDVNDILRAAGAEELKFALRRFDPYAIPGVRGDDKQRGRPRVFLPLHDYAVYWKYRVKEDHTTVVTKRDTDEDGHERMEFADLCGFRVASLSRVTVASAGSTMSGEEDNAPHTLFAVSVQAPRHGDKLVRLVFEDRKLAKLERWEEFGPIFRPTEFKRFVNLLERGADLGSKQAVNFVGIAWRNGRLIVNEGSDCYFADPDKQCPYAELSFPSGTIADARAVIAAYQSTFQRNAATLPLVWGLGGHLKVFLGFWPHMVMQSDKGMGKSTLVKRLERTLAFTMFSGQSIQTEFRLLTSCSHTSHPVGWEEISAREQRVIDKAVSILQESYQYTYTRRGSEMLEYLLCAPVLLAGEDVPVKSLTGKLVRTDLTGRKGPLMEESLPHFPMTQWLQFLTGMKREQVRGAYDRTRAWCVQHSMAADSDVGAERMAGNYAAVVTAWRLLCEFAGIDRSQGDFIQDVLAEMNAHVADTDADREPWVWIVEILLSEIAANNYKHPHQFDEMNGERCLLVRPQHIMDHISGTMALRDKWNMLPVKTARVLKRQLINAGVVYSEDVERTISSRREGHLLALSLAGLEKYGLYASVPDALFT